jgi:predicted RNA binding protein YcfA (HicA-like mRNA interferase family)
VSPRARRLSSNQMIALLKAQDDPFEHVSTKGSHAKYRNGAGKTAIVPLGRDPLPIGTQEAILTQAGITSRR